MIAIKSTEKINLVSQLETNQKYILVEVRDLNISNEKGNVTAIVVCHSFNYELDENEAETEVINNKKQIEAKPVVFTKSEMVDLMMALEATITSIDGFDSFQLAVLNYLAGRDNYFGIQNWVPA